MRIGIFADIHANQEALEACLAHAQTRGIDRYVFLGDLIGYGADPEWVLDTVICYQKLGALVLLGNHDEAVLLKKQDRPMNEDAQRVVEWTRSRLTDEHINFLAGLPLKVEESDYAYVHANAWAPDGWDYVMDVSDAVKSIAATKCRCTFIGHLHFNTLYYSGETGKAGFFKPVAGIDIPLSANRRWLAVIGSVGQPRDGNPAGCYAIYDLARKMLTYYRVPFNVEATAAKIREAGLPDWLGARLEMGV